MCEGVVVINFMEKQNPIPFQPGFRLPQVVINKAAQQPSCHIKVCVNRQLKCENKTLIFHARTLLHEIFFFFYILFLLSVYELCFGFYSVFTGSGKCRKKGTFRVIHVPLQTGLTAFDFRTCLVCISTMAVTFSVATRAGLHSPDLTAPCLMRRFIIELQSNRLALAPTAVKR